MHASRAIFGLLLLEALTTPAQALDCTRPPAFPSGSGALAASLKVATAEAALLRTPRYADFALRLGKLSATLRKLHSDPKSRELNKELAHDTGVAAEMFALLASNDSAVWKFDVTLKHVQDKAPDQSLFALIRTYQNVETALSEAAEHLRGAACTGNARDLIHAGGQLHWLTGELNKHSGKLVEQVRQVYKKDLREAHFEAIFAAIDCPCPIQDFVEPVNYHRGMKKQLLKSMVPELVEDFGACCGWYPNGTYTLDDQNQKMGIDVLTKEIKNFDSLIEVPAKQPWTTAQCDPQSPYTQLEQLALSAYTGSCSRTINEALRKNDAALMKKCDSVIDLLEIALGNFPDYHGRVIRYASLPQAVLDKYEPGKIVDDPAFMSTSRHQQWTWQGTTKLLIKTNHGKSIEALSSHPGEWEVLLRPGSRFRVIRKDKPYHDDTVVIELVEVDENDGQPQALKTTDSPAGK